MDKPQDYREICRVTRNLPYLREEEPLNSSACGGGVIGQGQIVWIQQSAEKKAPERLILAFADGIGLISLDRRFLVRAEQ